MEWYLSTTFGVVSVNILMNGWLKMHLKCESMVRKTVTFSEIGLGGTCQHLTEWWLAIIGFPSSWVELVQSIVHKRAFVTFKFCYISLAIYHTPRLNLATNCRIINQISNLNFKFWFFWILKILISNEYKVIINSFNSLHDIIYCV